MSSLDVRHSSSRGSKAVLPWAVGMGDHAGDGSTAPDDAKARSRAAIGVACDQPGLRYEVLHRRHGEQVMRADLLYGVGAVRDA
jgi:hypothetical protein